MSHLGFDPVTQGDPIPVLSKLTAALKTITDLTYQQTAALTMYLVCDVPHQNFTDCKLQRPPTAATATAAAATAAGQ